MIMSNLSNRYDGAVRDLPYGQDRTDEWNEFCKVALVGNSYARRSTTSDNPVNNANNDASKKMKQLAPVINLLPNYEDEKKCLNDLSEFDRTTYELKDSILKMAELLRREIKFEGIEEEGYNKDDHNATVQLETTIASFVARTANQIERLRVSIQSPPVQKNSNLFYRPKYNDTVANHRSGAVSCLLSLLREDVAGVLEGMQRRRKEREKKREEIRLLRQEFESNFDEPEIQTLTNNTTTLAPVTVDTNLSVAKPIEQQSRSFVKMQSSLPGEIDHIELAARHVMDERDNEHVANDYDLQQQELAKEVIQREPESALTDIKAVEQKIMEITSLLSQFSTLVSDQQEDVIAVYTNTNETKENMKKGQEQLIDAKERITKSRHRMAKFIVLTAIVLLWLNFMIQ